VPEQEDPHAGPDGGTAPSPPPPRDGPDDQPQPWWMKLLEPFRSEAAAFRLLLAIAAICAVIAVLVLIARAL
jgi:hypothetical protein